MKEIRLISCGLIGHVSDIKLIRTDTTLDLSQKAEKGMSCCLPLLCFLQVALQNASLCGIYIHHIYKNVKSNFSVVSFQYIEGSCAPLLIFVYILSYMLSASGYIVPISDGLTSNKLVPILFLFREQCSTRGSWPHLEDVCGSLVRVCGGFRQW